MFQDEARFGCRQDPRRAWAPPGVRPLVPTEIVREYGCAYAAVSPPDGVLGSLVLPDVNAERMSLFLAEAALSGARVYLDGAGRSGLAHRPRVDRARTHAALPTNGTQPGVDPAEQVWDELGF